MQKVVNDVLVESWSLGGSLEAKTSATTSIINNSSKLNQSWRTCENFIYLNPTMKSTYENKNSSAKPTHEALLNNALKAAQGKPIQTFPKSEGGLLMADERAQLPADPEQVMNQIDKT